MNQTPDTPSDARALAQCAAEAAERAASISDLRALADMLENEPTLPMPMSFSCAVYLPRPGNDTAGPVNEVFALAEKLGTAVTYDRREGRVETAWIRGCISYRIYTRTAGFSEMPNTVVLSSPAQVPGLEATSRAGDEQRGSAA